MKNIQTVLNAILSKNVFEYLLIDKEMRIIHVSLGMMQFLNVIPTEGSDIREYLPEFVGLEKDIMAVFDGLERSLSLKTVRKGEYYFNIYADYYDQNKTLILLQNITEVTKAQREALQYSNQVLLLNDTLQKIIDGQNTLIFVTDNHENIIFANKRLLEYFKIGDQDELKKNPLKLYQKISDRLQSYEELYKEVQSKEKHVTIGDDTFMIETAQIDATHHLFTLIEVTDIYQKKKSLELEVEFDALTGLMRKKYFDLKLQYILKEKTPFALVVVDIDDFKAINDIHGHIVGDTVLKQFAALLKKSLREDDLIARWGGEEFLFAINIDDIEKALQRVESVRKRIEEYTFDTVGHLTASFGVAWREEGDDLDMLLQRADKALYKAKNNGKNRVILKKREKLRK